MPEERLDLVQAKLISNIKESVPSAWKVTYKKNSGELSIFIYAPKGIFIDRLRKLIATVTHYQNKRYLLLHFEDDAPTIRKNLVEDSLRDTTKFPAYQI